MLRNRNNPRHCVPVTLDRAEDGSFSNFPTAPELADFNPSDRKFMAAALMHGANPPVVNATDSDWYHHREALTRRGIRVEFSYPTEILRVRRA